MLHSKTDLVEKSTKSVYFSLQVGREILYLKCLSSGLVDGGLEDRHESRRDCDHAEDPIEYWAADDGNRCHEENGKYEGDGEIGLKADLGIEHAK